MFNFIKNLRKPENKIPRKANYTTFNYSALLKLLNKPVYYVEEFYDTKNSLNNRFIGYELELKTGESVLLRDYALVDNWHNNTETVVSILEREVGKVWEDFYKKNEGKIIVYSPLDCLEYCGMVSEGWYLLHHNGKFSLQCEFRVLKEEK